MGITRVRSLALVRRFGQLAAPLVLGGALAAQGTSRVDPQTLIDLAAPGATVLVPSGAHGELVVAKPLVLLGADPRPSVGPIRLAGPGGGRVALANLAIGDPRGGGAAVSGRGFAQVHVEGCELTGPLVVKAVPFLEVARTTIRLAGAPSSYVDARGASTSLLDVVLEPLSPPMTNPFADVVTARLGLTNVSLPGRVDAKRIHTYANDLAVGGAPRPGGRIDLTWSLSGPSVVVFQASGTQHPMIRPDGIWFLAVDATIVAVEPSPGGTSFPIPASPALIGTPFAFQVHDWILPRALSRVVTGVIR